jgi:hypothetical protein
MSNTDLTKKRGTKSGARHYDFRIKTMFSSSLPPLVCRTRVLFMLFVFVVYSGVQQILTVYMSNMAGVLRTIQKTKTMSNTDPTKKLW